MIRKAYLVADETTNGLLGRADRLVPGTGRTVGVLLGDAAVAGNTVAAGLDTSLGLLVLSLGMGLGFLTLGLLGSVASQTANSALDSTRSGVDIGLEGGRGLLVVGLVRHSSGVVNGLG